MMSFRPSSMPKTKITGMNSNYARFNNTPKRNVSFGSYDKNKMYQSDLFETLSHQAHDPKDPHSNPKPGEVRISIPNPGHGFSTFTTKTFLWGSMLTTSAITGLAVAFPFLMR